MDGHTRNVTESSTIENALTAEVLSRFAASGSELFREVSQSLVRHLHAFIREVLLLEELVLFTQPAKLLLLVGSKPFALSGVDLFLLLGLRRVSVEIPSSLAILEMGRSSGAARTSRIASRRNSGGYGGFVAGT